MAKSKASTPNSGSGNGAGKRTTSASSKRSPRSARKNTGLSRHAVANVLQNSLSLVREHFGSVVFGLSPQGLTVHLPAGLGLCARCQNLFAGEGPDCGRHSTLGTAEGTSGEPADALQLGQAGGD